MDDDAIEPSVRDAYGLARRAFDLSDCWYGKPLTTGPFIDWPLNYYYFLSGLVAQLRCRRILEIGTHYGGSILAMARGIDEAGLTPSAEIVTVDVARRNAEGFGQAPQIKRIKGSCFAPETAELAKLFFTGPVDLLFVDIVHTYEQTRRCLDIYVPLVSPRIVILDDIRLNESMARLWAELTEQYGARAVDITEAAHREDDVGFGLLLPDAETPSRATEPAHAGR